jgi:hypothetical protein
MRWTKLDLTCICLKKLTHRYFKSTSSIYTSWIDRVSFFYFFSPVWFMSAQLTSSPSFSLLSVASPSADIATLSHRVTLPSHGANTSSLSILHLSTTLRSLASPLERKPKHWIDTITIGHPTRTARLWPSTAIKRSTQPWSLSPPLKCLHFASSLVRASHHQSSTRRRHSLSPSSHAHRPSTQRHPQW